MLVTLLDQVKERLRDLGGSRRLVSDVMTFDEKYAKAVDYACANVVLCDTLADGRKLRFQEKVDCKVVTLDGSLISRSNTMSGGKSRLATDKAGRWDRKQSETLKKQLRELSDKRIDIEKEGFLGSTGSSGGGGGGSGGRRRRRGGSNSAAGGTAAIGGNDGKLYREMEALRAQRETLTNKIRSLEEFAEKHEASPVVFLESSRSSRFVLCSPFGVD